MSEFQLSNFPLEILEMIISYVPKSHLYKLDGIDYLRNPVARNIYSSVIINGRISYDYNWNDPSITGYDSLEIDKSKPEFSCVSSLTNFIQENHLPFPKCIYFAYPMDIVFAYRRNPSILHDCIIVVDLHLPFGFDANSPDLEKSYLPELISLPLKIKRATFCEVLHQRLHESSAQFTRNLVSAQFYRAGSLETVFEDNRYQNLVNLEIKFVVKHEMVKLIPRSVKTLGCKILCTEFQVDDFGFPSGLRKLNVTLVNYPEQYSVDFSNLEHLVNLEYYFFHNGCKIEYYNVSFPKSLRSLKSNALDMEAVKNQCPELTSFDCLSVRHMGKRSYAFEFPEKLTDLSTLTGVLAKVEKVKDDPSVIQKTYSKRRRIGPTMNPSSIKLPKNLQSLHIDGERYKGQFGKSQTLFSNREENILHDLVSLTLLQAERFLRFGPLPPSLTQLTICSAQRVKSLNSGFFDNLKSITSLKFLKIYCPLGAYFDYELPQKLEYLELSNSQLCKISLRSKSLKRFYLYQTKFSVVSPENFQIPGSLVELKLFEPNFLSDEGGIQSFAKSFVFPQNLRSLQLGCDAMHKIPKLPPNLKTLDIICLATRVKQYDFDNLPTTLEDLKLTNTADRDTYSFTPNLSHLVNLKKLNFSSHRFSYLGVVDLDTFPKSLTDLSMSRCEIQKFIGSFTDFPSLANLNLCNNKLGDWLSSSPNEFSFGAAIRIIVLTGNSIDNDTAIRLLYKLEENPKFGFLAVNKMPIPEDLQHLVRFNFV